MKIALMLVGLLVKLNPLYFLLASIKAMGWSVVVEKDNAMVEGLIIGKQNYIDRTTGEVKDD